MNVIEFFQPPAWLDAHLRGRRRRLAARAGTRTRSALPLHRDGVETGGDVGVRVCRPADLVEELRGHGPDRHQPVGAGVLGDHATAIRPHLGYRKPRPVQARDLVEERVVAAGALRAALDDVTGDHRSGERVPVGALPLEPPRRRADDQRRVGDARTDHDVGTALERRGDAEAAEVGVGAHHRRLQVGERRALVEMDEALARRLQRVEPRHEIVALDVRDDRAQAELLVHRPRRRRAARRIEPAGVHHDLDAALQAARRHLLELPQERAGIAEVRVLEAILQQDQQRQLGEIVAGQHVDRPALDHLPRRAEAVAVEAGAVGDAEGVGHETSVSQ